MAMLPAPRLGIILNCPDQLRPHNRFPGLILMEKFLEKLQQSSTQNQTGVWNIVKIHLISMVTGNKGGK